MIILTDAEKSFDEIQHPFMIKTVDCRNRGMLPQHNKDHIRQIQSFPDSSVGKEWTCDGRPPRTIPELERSAGEGIDYLLQYSWASLVAQLVKNPPAMWETWVLIPRLERSPGEGKGYPLQCSGLENSMDCIVHGVTKSRTQLRNFHFTSGKLELWKSTIWVHF